MTKNRELFYWTENPDWYDCDEDGDNITISSNAPERAKKSFEMWKARENFYSNEKNLS